MSMLSDGEPAKLVSAYEGEQSANDNPIATVRRLRFKPNSNLYDFSMFTNPTRYSCVLHAMQKKLSKAWT